MNNKKIAREILLIAKNLVSVEFETEKELQDYKKKHKVAPKTKLVVKDEGSKSKKPSSGGGLGQMLKSKVQELGNAIKKKLFRTFNKLSMNALMIYSLVRGTF